MSWNAQVLTQTINAFRAKNVQGTEVYGPDGKNIGEIDHLIIDKMSGRVGYAVMSFGGFLGLGHSHYPIPWGALSYDKSLGGFRTNITEQQLRDAPEFSDDSWQDRDWETPDTSSLRCTGILGDPDGPVARKRNAVRFERGGRADGGSTASEGRNCQHSATYDD
jgi:sporulation protein YlmC with PRC-barrel domain